MTFENELVGQVRRHPRMARRDRKAAILYSRSAGRRVVRSEQWRPTDVESWISRQKELFIAESLHEGDERVLGSPPHERVMLLRVAAHATFGLPGGVLVERLDVLARAVLGRYLQRAKCQLRYGPKLRLVSAKQVDNWVTGAGRAAVEEELSRFVQAIQRYVVETMYVEAGPGDVVEYLGAGPLRDVDLARTEYQRLASSTSAANIRRHLTVYGYMNPKGSVGRWSHEQVQSLRATPRG